MKVLPEVFRGRLAVLEFLPVGPLDQPKNDHTNGHQARRQARLANGRHARVAWSSSRGASRLVVFGAGRNGRESEVWVLTFFVLSMRSCLWMVLIPMLNITGFHHRTPPAEHFVHIWRLESVKSKPPAHTQKDTPCRVDLVDTDLSCRLRVGPSQRWSQLPQTGPVWD